MRGILSLLYYIVAFANCSANSRTAIGKRVTPHETTRSRPGNHHYCFVDFETKEQTNAAMKALNGRVIMGWKLKVSLAGGVPDKLADSHTSARYDRRAQDGASRPDSSRSANAAQANRAAASTDWRRRDGE